MRVRAIAKELTPEQRDAIGGLARVQRAGPPIGEEHLVLGLVFAREHPRLGNGAWVIYQDALGNPLIEPLALYEVTDPRPSRYWHVDASDDHTLQLWPPAFGRPHFLEAAAEARSPERAELDALSRRLADEERRSEPT